MDKVKIDFVCKDPGASYYEAFDKLKKYQELGLADKYSGVVFDGVRTPAGYYNNADDSFAVYVAIIKDRLDLIEETFPKNLDEFDAWMLSGDIAEEYYKYQHKDCSRELDKISKEKALKKNKKDINNDVNPI